MINLYLSLQVACERYFISLKEDNKRNENGTKAVHRKKQRKQQRLKQVAI